jgi:tRNA1Val (adenine37-N6)-methyltransferase
MNEFRFKQFTIKQNLCAMKVGTDGVLLGAWSCTPSGNVLDVGSGSGLISLMVAQRNTDCLIDTIDIEESAYLQTKGNIKESKWNSRIKAYHSSFQSFSSEKKYKLIISNPPFFINATKSINNAKNLARHTDELPFNDFINKVKELLAKDGILSLILPVQESLVFTDIALKNNLYLNRKCLVKPNEKKEPKRVLLEFSFSQIDLKKELLVIETEKRHHYTEEYRNLTRDFYLKF